MKKWFSLLGKVFTHNYCDGCGFTQDPVFTTEILSEGGIKECRKCIATREKLRREEALKEMMRLDEESGLYERDLGRSLDPTPVQWVRIQLGTAPLPESRAELDWILTEALRREEQFIKRHREEIRRASI